MSHFSRIKTNISSFEILTKTLQDLGFKYEFKNNLDHYIVKDKLSQCSEIYVYHNLNDLNPVFNFIWDGVEYILIADFQLWSLETSVDNFVEILNQKYAYNMILNQGFSHGFQKVREIIMPDGSLKIMMQKWDIS